MQRQREAEAVEGTAASIATIIVGALKIASTDAKVAAAVEQARGGLRMLAERRPDVYAVVSRRLLAAIAESGGERLH